MPRGRPAIERVWKFSTKDFYWLVGYLEGEGSFHFHKVNGSNKVYLYPVIAVSTTDKDVAERLVGLLQARMDTKGRVVRPEWKPIYLVRVDGPSVYDLMRILQPYMGERRQQQIDEVLKMA